MYFTPLVLASFIASASALATPIHGIPAHHRRHVDIAKARAAAPEPASPIVSTFVSKRGLKKRCKARATSSSLAIPSGVGNVAGDPSSEVKTISSSVAATSSSEEAPAPAPTTSATKTKTSTKAAAPTTPAPAPSSEAPAPAPTTVKTPSKKPTTPAPPPAPKPTSSSGSGSSSSGGNLGQFSGAMTGQGTWYDTGLTACGVTNNDGEFIAAVSELLFDNFPGATANPNLNPVCGKKAQVTYQGKTITVTITDRCTACKVHDLDFTPTAFQQLADLGAGRIDGIEWHFI